MAKNSTVTNVDNGDDLDATWGDQVKASIEAAFADKKMHTVTYASPLDFDLDDGSLQYVELAGSPNITISNEETGRGFTLVFKQDATGGRAPNWFSGIKWAFGVTPAFSSDPNTYDVFTFIPLGGGAYLGFAGGLGAT